MRVYKLAMLVAFCTISNTWASDDVSMRAKIDEAIRTNKYNLPSLGTDRDSEYYVDRSDHVFMDYTADDLAELSAQSLDIYNVYLNYFDSDNKDFKKVNPTQSLIFIQSLVAQDDYVDVHNRNILSSSGEIPSPQELAKAESKVVSSYKGDNLQISPEIRERLEREKGYVAYYSGNYGPKDVVVKLSVNQYGDTSLVRYYLTNEDKKDEFISTKFDEFFNKIDKTGVNAREYTNEILGVFLLLEATPIDEMIMGSETYKTMDRLAREAEVYLKQKYEQVVEIVEFNGSYMSNRLRYQMGVVGNKYKTQFVAEEVLENSYFNTQAHASLSTDNLDYRLTHKLRMNSNSNSFYTELRHDIYTKGEVATVTMGNSDFKSSFFKKKEKGRDEERLTLSGRYDDWTLSGSHVRLNGKDSGRFEAGKLEEINEIGETLRRSFTISENEDGEPEFRFKMELKHF